ncbi:helix-turn-helix transcriptional regulator [Corynebacterium striatum]|uniref:helix-turn-helix transcriptional regulator n=1 Tax=Corynebacterium striatum TaxID=43770 RepID=UPI003B5BFD91
MSDFSQVAPVMRTPEAAEFLQISPRTLEGWRRRGEGPKYSRLGTVVVYTIDDLQAFVDERAAV